MKKIIMISIILFNIGCTKKSNIINPSSTNNNITKTNTFAGTWIFTKSISPDGTIQDLTNPVNYTSKTGYKFYLDSTYQYYVWNINDNVKVISGSLVKSGTYQINTKYFVLDKGYSNQDTIIQLTDTYFIFKNYNTCYMTKQ